MKHDASLFLVHVNVSVDVTISFQTIQGPRLLLSVAIPDAAIYLLEAARQNGTPHPYSHVPSAGLQVTPVSG